MKSPRCGVISPSSRDAKLHAHQGQFRRKDIFIFCLVKHSFLLAASLLLAMPSTVFASEWAQPEGWPYWDVRVCYASTMQMAIEEKLVVVASTVGEYCDCVVELHKQNYNSDSCGFWDNWDE